MGSAILGGILDATRSDNPSDSKISRFIISTKTAQSAERLRSTFKADESRIRFLHSQNVQAMKDADIILLACKPYMAEDILGQDGVRDALAGKFVISILAGTTTQDLAKFIYKDSPRNEEKRPFIVRTQPNVAASVRKSMTIIEIPDPALPESLSNVLAWIFEQIGNVKFLTADLFNVGTILVGASMGILSVPVEGMLDGGVAGGLGGLRAWRMAELLKSGAHPAILRENISSPRGCTIQSIMRLEREATRGTFAQAVIDGVNHLQGDRK
ncbi:pyrroline-5-carboxylate reductase [Aspergillus sclerotialis]|uniref:Pyrroline-5-carboxylate reductase n=1 Tax=Aspergillus sclerotialis TaxID=2070753 RepID=A0A3A2ZL99_9EURO|nr:pyrroline-5-carboxylate reductase [Aspergillus sclerotialis]